MINKKIVKCVIGASFGDEGKGLMTDYFCSSLLESGYKNVLNIRYNGGHQASHTVVTPEKKRHIFNGIGAGSFNHGVDTYFGPEFLFNPISVETELKELNDSSGRSVYVDRMCRVVLPYDIYLNFVREKKRGMNRHGSCMNGIFECIKRNKAGFGLLVADLYNGKESLEKQIDNIVELYFKPQLIEMGESVEDIDSLECFKEGWKDGLVQKLLNSKQYITKIEDRKGLFESFDAIVFEGAQGLMLDKDNTEYMPHLTPSCTGLPYIKDLLSVLEEQNMKFDLEVCYVTRSYNTRHGAGRLNEETEKENLGNNVAEYTNYNNLGQGNFRFGYLQLEDLGKHIAKDVDRLEELEEYQISVCVTHLDQTEGKLVTNQARIDATKFGFCELLNKYTFDKLSKVNMYYSYGENRDYVMKGE